MIDSILLVDPYYNGPSSLEIRKEYVEPVAKAFPELDMIPYVIPGRSGTKLLPEDLGILFSEYKNVSTVKEATGDLARLTHLKPLVSPGFLLLSGDDETAYDFLKHGGHGEISVTANIAPAEVARMCNLMVDGELEVAKGIHDALMPLHKTLFLEANPIPVKWALAQMGKCGGTLRLPLTPLDEKFHQQLLNALQRCRLV